MVVYGCAEMSTARFQPRRPRLVCALLAAIAAGTLPAAGAPAAIVAPAPAIIATVAPAEIAQGMSVTVSGALPGATSAGAAASVALQAAPYPYRGYVTLARTATSATGAFSFAGVRPDRNTRLRVVLAAQPALASAALAVTVDPRVALAARSLRAGATRLSVRIVHTLHSGAGATQAWWYVQARGSRTFRLQDVTQTRELAPGVLYASATIDPPSRRFTYRVCVNPPWEAAMGAAGAHGRCPRHDFRLQAHDGH
jgi:hypothetical protein